MYWIEKRRAEELHFSRLKSELESQREGDLCISLKTKHQQQTGTQAMYSGEKKVSSRENYLFFHRMLPLRSTTTNHFNKYGHLNIVVSVHR